MINKICKQCGESFKCYKESRKFCSRECYNKWRDDPSRFRKKDFNVSKKKLQRLYWEQEKSLREIANIFDISKPIVSYWMEKFGIKKRSSSEGTKVWAKHHPNRLKVPKPKLEGNTNYSKEALLKGRKVLKNPKIWERIRKKISRVISKKWKNPEYRKKTLNAIHEYRKKHTRPTKLEEKIINLIKRHNLPFKYVGNGDVTIHGLNPDFIDTDGSKRIIEVFGDYWHKDKENIPWKQTEFGRKSIFSKYGFNTLILWEHELNKWPDKKIVNRIKEFK